MVIAGFRPTKLVSGGQTGVDRGALIAARKLGYPFGGFCTADERAEDGPIPEEFQLTACDSNDYLVRTRLNVEHSDATLILSYESERALTGGTKRTVEFCRAFERPHYVGTLSIGASRPKNLIVAKAVRRWLTFLEPPVLNVAGPRESKAPGIQQQTEEVLSLLLQTPTRCVCGRAVPEWVWQQAEEGGKPVRCSVCGHITYRSDFE